MKRKAKLVLAILLLPIIFFSCALADEIDLASISTVELNNLKDRIEEELANRDEEGTLEISEEPIKYSYKEYTYSIQNDSSAIILEYSGSKRELIIPDSLDGHNVTAIGEKAFASNEYIKSLSIPEGVIRIEPFAFAYCDKLSSVELPGSLKVIGDNSFCSCSKLSSIVIPDSVELISDEAFFHCSLYSIQIGDNVKEIGNRAFASNPYSNITLPDSIEKIDANPFADCDSLTSIFVSPHHDYLSVIDSILYSKPDKRLICCPSGKYSCTIPNGIQIIGAYSFYSNENYLSIELPDSVINIEEDAFSESDISSISIHKNVQEIGANPFRDINLRYITIDNDCFEVIEINYNSLIYDKTNKRIITGCKSDIFPYDAEIIGAKAYYGEFMMTEFIVPQGITTIEDEAFASCIQMEKIVIPDSVVSIGRDAFAHCNKLSCTVGHDSYAEKYCIENNIPYCFSDNNDWLSP